MFYKTSFVYFQQFYIFTVLALKSGSDLKPYHNWKICHMGLQRKNWNVSTNGIQYCYQFKSDKVMIYLGLCQSNRSPWDLACQEYSIVPTHFALHNYTSLPWIICHMGLHGVERATYTIPTLGFCRIGRIYRNFRFVFIACVEINTFF